MIYQTFQESESTVFKGSKRPCTKECILIIDRETGVSILSNAFILLLFHFLHMFCKEFKRSGNPIGKELVKLTKLGKIKEGLERTVHKRRLGGCTSFLKALLEAR